jgi:hypothetical protein
MHIFVVKLAPTETGLSHDVEEVVAALLAATAEQELVDT